MSKENNVMPRETLDTIVERIKNLSEKVDSLTADVKATNQLISSSFATKDDLARLEKETNEKIRPLSAFIYALASLILLSVGGAIVNLVIKK